MDNIYQKLRQQQGFLEQRQCLQESLLEIAQNLQKTKAKSRFINVNLNLTLYRFVPTHLELCRFNEEPEHTRAYMEFRKLRENMKTLKQEKERIGELHNKKLDLQMTGHIAINYLTQGKKEQNLIAIAMNKSRERSDSVNDEEMTKILNTKLHSVKGYYTEKQKIQIKNVNDFCVKIIQKQEV